MTLERMAKMKVVMILIGLLCTESLIFQSCRDADHKEKVGKETKRTLPEACLTMTSKNGNELIINAENEITVEITGPISSACIIFRMKEGDGEFVRIGGPVFSMKPNSFRDVVIEYENRCRGEKELFVFTVVSE